MKNLIVAFVLIFNFFFQGSLFSQTFEVSLLSGIASSNIVDNNSDFDRQVIGNALWNLRHGINLTYSPKNPLTEGTIRYSLRYQRMSKGSLSEINEKDRIEFDMNSFGLTVGYAENIGKGFIAYADGGFAYNVIENESSFNGELSQTVAFPDLRKELRIKPGELSFIFLAGLEKNINNLIKVFTEINGDFGITEINANTGQFRTSQFGLNLGIKLSFGG